MAPSSPSVSTGIVLGFFPAPIAHAFHRATNAEEGDVDSLYEDLLGALLAHVAWTAALASGGELLDRARDGRPAKNGLLLERAREAFARLAADAERPDAARALLPEAEDDPAAFARSALHRALDETIELRNRARSGAHLDRRDDLRASVHRALALASSLRFQAIVVPRAQVEPRAPTLRRYRAAVYRGTNVRYPVDVETDAELVPKRAYLAFEGRVELLPLHPLIVEAQSSAGSPLPELYAVRDLAKLSVRAIATGREAPERIRAVVASALGNSTPRSWIRPRHLHVAGLCIVAPRRFGPGDLVDGRFEVARHIGSGACADVYEALDRARDGARVALKFMPAEIAADAQSLQRFQLEVESLRKIDHPHVLRLLERGEFAGGRYLVAELANGWELADARCIDAGDLLRAAGASGGGGLPEPLVREIALHVAKGLSELHERQLVHRDVKPGNILLFDDARGRRAVIADLGIARRLGGAAMTMPGLPIGTPEYMAPEATDAVEPERTLDVYAFGIVLYELLSGAPPFRAADPAATRELHRRPLPSLKERVPELSPAFESLIHACLAKDPKRRPRHGHDVLARLRRLDERSADAGEDPLEGSTLGPYAIGRRVGELEGAHVYDVEPGGAGDAVRVAVLRLRGAERAEALRRIELVRELRHPALPLVRDVGVDGEHAWFAFEEARRHGPVSFKVWASSAADAARALAQWHADASAHEHVADVVGGDARAPLALALPSLVCKPSATLGDDAVALIARLRAGCGAWQASSSGAQRALAALTERRLAALARGAVTPLRIESTMRGIARSAASSSAWTGLRTFVGLQPRRIAVCAALIVATTVTLLAFAFEARREREQFLRDTDAQVDLYPQLALAELQRRRSERGADRSIDWRIGILDLFDLAERGDSRDAAEALTLVGGIVSESADWRQSPAFKHYVQSRAAALRAWSKRQLSHAAQADPAAESAFWMLTMAALEAIIPASARPVTDDERRELVDYLGAFAAARRRPSAQPGRSEHALIAGLYVTCATMARSEELYAPLRDPQRVRDFVAWLTTAEPVPYNEYYLRACAALALEELVDAGKVSADVLRREVDELRRPERIARGRHHLSREVEYRDRRFRENAPRDIDEYARPWLDELHARLEAR